MEAEEVRQDRWVAVIFLVFAGLFALIILLWEPLMSLFHR
jgi:hypothetical protein